MSKVSPLGPGVYNDIDKDKIDVDYILEIGFEKLGDSYSYTIDGGFDKPQYKSLSLKLCNDKGNGEYYLFLREGYNTNRSNDRIVTLSSNILYKGELKYILEFIKKINK